jgi:ribonuclease G
VEKTLCIDSVPGEVRVALVEDEHLVELQIERSGARGIAGDIYLGRVRNILPGMQAAFVDLGLERDGFLYVEDTLGPATLPSGDEAAIPDVPPPVAARIEERVREGQTLVVQVAKEPIAQKGARITAHVALPGGILVFLPGVDHIGVSRRIEDPDERARLREVVQGIADGLQAPGGFIVRTAGAGLEGGLFEADARSLVDRWRAIRTLAESVAPPALLHAESGATARALRDLLSAEVREIVVDAPELANEIRQFLQRTHPALVPAVKLHDGPRPLFEARGIGIQIDRALRPRVWLKSGGHIVINQTEALVAIDVNTGKYVGRSGLEETIVHTNLEAVEEIVRQIRLRDLGGILVIDFIDMQGEEGRAAVAEALERALRRDRARSRVQPISAFGLVEITRQRTRPSLERLLCRPCPACGGAGQVRSIETMVLELARELRRARPMSEDTPLVVCAHPGTTPLLRAGLESAASDGGWDPGPLRFEDDGTLRPDQWSVRPE